MLSGSQSKDVGCAQSAAALLEKLAESEPLKGIVLKESHTLNTLLKQTPFYLHS